MSDIVTLNGYKIKDEKAVRSYESIAQMKADTKLKEDYHVKTKGYYQANDGGNAEYIIIDDETLVDDGGSIHVLNNGLRAVLITSNEINVKQFGAKGDGVNDDTLSIQNAINSLQTSGGKVIIPKEYTFKVNTVTEGDFNYCIKLYSNIELCGGGVILLDSSNVSGDNAIITTLNNNNDYENIYIHDIIIDGNCNDISTTRHLSNICLFNVSNTIIERVKSINAIYCGIMIRADEIGHCLNNRILNNYVYNAKYIGIQQSYNQNIIITGNTVDTTVDNAIDCYANDTSTYAQTYNTIVSNNNIVRSKKGGIFIESLDKVIVESNNIYCALRGIILNRINSGVLDSIISNNRIDGGYDIDSTLYGESGIMLINNNYYNLISNNIITNCIKPFNVGNCSYTVISNNNVRDIKGDYMIFLRSTSNNLFIRSRITNNNLTDNSNVDKKLISPIGIGTSYPNRTSRLIIENNYKLYLGSLIPTELYDGILTVTPKSQWGDNGYLYYNSKTLLNLQGKDGAVISTSVGNYLYNTSNSTWYKISAKSSTEHTITDVEGNDGDYTSAFTNNQDIYYFTEENYIKVTTN